MCEQCDGDDTVGVQMVMAMPEERATALLTDFRDKKLAGEPATIAVNVMHVMMVGTTGELPEPVEGQERRMRHVTVPRRSRTGIPRWQWLLFLVVLVAIGLTTPFASRLTLMVEIWVWLAFLGFRVGMLIRRR